MADIRKIDTKPPERDLEAEVNAILRQRVKAAYQLGRSEADVAYAPLVDALKRIANEDYRGPRPWSATIAFEALAQLPESLRG